MKSSAKINKPTIIDQRSEYKQLKLKYQQLMVEVYKIRKQEQKIQWPADLDDLNNKDKLNFAEKIEKLVNRKELCEHFEDLHLFNESLEFLPDSVDKPKDVLYRKLYKADCEIVNNFTFFISFLVYETIHKREFIHSIDVTIKNAAHRYEVSNGLRKLKKEKDLYFLLAALKHYSKLHKQRENLLKTFPTYFEVTQNEEGSFQIVVQLKEKNLFNVDWKIEWNPILYNYMHLYEVTVTDDEFLERSELLFKKLCKATKSVKDADKSLIVWNELIKLIEDYYIHS